MAKEKDVKKQKKADSAEKKSAEKTTEKTEKKDGDAKKAPVNPLMHWVIVIVITVLFAGAGFGLGLMLTDMSVAKTTKKFQQQQQDTKQTQDLTTEAAIEAKINEITQAKDVSDKYWYCDLEPVVANLDVPGVTRYVRATLTLKISSNMNEEKGLEILEEKKPLLTNWLTIYLASLNLDDVRGHRNLKRIQSQILDAFNEKLFPDAKSHIKEVLFKEFAIQ
ncbi:MAG: flagellar basal body-associated FliL family protein [Planctomycetes bacterium]|nr:flagellar basal body-associated FliL family protein [Planctomycetota bacterium]